jgi:SNF2 family DNA or RNA helicase
MHQLQQVFANIPPAADRADQRTIAGDKRRLLTAAKSFGFAKVKAVDGKWKIQGMDSPLYHHQLPGAQWMIVRELSNGAPFGGILADSMGLGKTVETIACIIANPPPQSDIDRGVTATLVVAPAGVLDQWHAEIEKHTDNKHLKHIMIYKSSMAKSSLTILSSMDVVLCSYQEIMKQFPCSSGGGLNDIARMPPGAWLRQSGPETGILHQVDWYRIVLDEAHTIKNYNSKTSMPC